MTPLKVEVTDTDIWDGVECSPSLCPVARAVKRLFPGRQVLVASRKICVAPDPKADPFGERLHYVMPMSAWQFVKEFDRTGRMTPFHFTAHPRRPKEQSP